jgi:hypothetical protein
MLPSVVDFGRALRDERRRRFAANRGRHADWVNESLHHGDLLVARGRPAGFQRHLLHAADVLISDDVDFVRVRPQSIVCVLANSLCAFPP